MGKMISGNQTVSLKDKEAYLIPWEEHVPTLLEFNGDWEDEKGPVISLRIEIGKPKDRMITSMFDIGLEDAKKLAAYITTIVDEFENWDFENGRPKK